MRKTIKNKLVLLLALISVVCTAFAINAVLSQRNASADVSAVFDFESGAYVKIADDGGLRFRLKVDEASANSLKNAETNELVFYVIPQKYFNDVVDKNYEALLNVDGKVHAQKVVADKAKIYKGTTADGSESYFANCLLDINLAEHANKYNAVDFVVVAVWGEKEAISVARNMYSVANACALDGYIDEVSSVYDWFGTADYPITANSAEDYDKLVSVLTKSANDYKAKYIKLGVGDTQNYFTDYEHVQFEEYTVTVSVNNESFGAVSESSITVPCGTAITVNGNQITLGEHVITATPADADLYVLSNFVGVTSTVNGDLNITANFDYRTELTTAAQLSKFLMTVKTSYNYSGKTVTLANDIDMSGYIGNGGDTAISSYGGGMFKGTLDGQGHTISNLYVARSIFNTLEAATIKNIMLNLKVGDNWWYGIAEKVNSATFDNVYLDAPAGAARGWDYALAYLVNSVLNVKNCVVNRQHNADGKQVMYQVNTNAKVTFENCYVIGNTIELYGINEGSVIGGDNVLYTNNPQGALTAITTAGLTAANGWNTNIWTITDSGDLTFNNNVVIKKA